MQVKTSSYKIHSKLIDQILTLGYKLDSIETEKNKNEQEKTSGYIYYQFSKAANKYEQMHGDGFRHGLFVTDDGTLQYNQTVYYGYILVNTFIPIKRLLKLKHHQSKQFNTNLFRLSVEQSEAISYGSVRTRKIRFDQETVDSIWKSKYRQKLTQTRRSVLPKQVITDCLTSRQFLTGSYRLLQIMIHGNHYLTKPTRHARKLLDLFDILCDTFQKSIRF